MNTVCMDKRHYQQVLIFIKKMFYCYKDNYLLTKLELVWQKTKKENCVASIFLMVMEMRYKLIFLSILKKKKHSKS